MYNRAGGTEGNKNCLDDGLQFIIYFGLGQADADTMQGNYIMVLHNMIL